MRDRILEILLTIIVITSVTLVFLYDSRAKKMKVSVEVLSKEVVELVRENDELTDKLHELKPEEY